MDRDNSRIFAAQSMPYDPARLADGLTGFFRSLHYGSPKRMSRNKPPKAARARDFRLGLPGTGLSLFTQSQVRMYYVTGRKHVTWPRTCTIKEQSLLGT